ncbi:hypothetical protein LSH36_13g15044 [Paralvinella palmiformis]|uniref:FLYWCH-type domain-containing protein n=1 Tax=Paralvinella palmiformis TaxID=53620 RepID=A0AAD9KD02_9ANNE|nr:hypothetical protein LSH36_13g15044 [Paralvinella palmiformis]
MDTDDCLSPPPRSQRNVDVSASSTTGATYDIVSDTPIRGRDKLSDGVGYFYTVKRRTPRCTTWRCTLRSKTVNCAATVRPTGHNFVCVPREHVHQPSLGAELSQQLGTKRSCRLTTIHFGHQGR